MVNIFWMKHAIDNRARALESTRGSLHCAKIPWTLVHKRLKVEQESLPTLSILSRAESTSHSLKRHYNVATHGEWNELYIIGVNEMIDSYSANQLKRFHLVRPIR